jgi:hypothetical protein
MNRAERRKQKNATPPKTYVLTEDQIAKLKQDAVQEAMRKTFLMFMSIPVMVLHDKFGFGQTRLGRFMDYAVMWYESVYNDEMRLMELVKVAGDECGIHVLDVGGKK